MASMPETHPFQAKLNSCTDDDCSVVLTSGNTVSDVVPSSNGSNELEKADDCKMFGDNNDKLLPIADDLQQYYTGKFPTQHELANIDEKHLSTLRQLLSRRGSVLINTTDAIKPFEVQSLRGTTLYIAQWNIDVSAFLIATRK